MPERTIPIRKEICLNEQELNLIRHKMKQLDIRNFGAYARNGIFRIRKKQGLGNPAVITLNYPADAKLIQPKETVENLSG